MRTLINFFHNGGVDPNYRLETDREKTPVSLALTVMWHENGK